MSEEQRDDAATEPGKADDPASEGMQAGAAVDDADAMTDEEKAMLEALEDDQSGADAKPPATANAAETPPVAVHPVDMEPLKDMQRGAPNADGNLRLILDLPVEVKVEVGASRLTIREVLNLAPGSVIELDRTAGSPADIVVNGSPVGQGDVVVVDENYGIRINRLVNPEDRLNSL